MKLIGITGKPGSGKTTISMMLENEVIGVIHVDKIMERIRKKYFRFMQHEQKQKKLKLVKILYMNKYTYNLFVVIRRMLLEKSIEKEILRMQQERKKSNYNR